MIPKVMVLSRPEAAAFLAERAERSGVAYEVYKILKRRTHNERALKFKKRARNRLRQAFATYVGGCPRCAAPPFQQMDERGESGHLFFYEDTEDLNAANFEGHQFIGESVWDPCPYCPRSEICVEGTEDPYEGEPNPAGLYRQCGCCCFNYAADDELSKEKIP